MGWREQLNDVNQQILNGELDRAEAQIEQLSASIAIENRMLEHYRAIIQFHRGDVPGAKQRMERAREMWGDNVNLLRDLIVCQFNMQDMVGFRANLTELELLLVEKEAELEPRTLMVCELMLGQFLEEEARLAPAMLFYERALTRPVKPEARFRALMQKARWQALYEPTPELSTFYRDLISYPKDSETQDFRVELEHTLMLIELRLVGSDHAWRRVERLNPDVPEIDRRLLIFDFIEGALSQDLALEDEVRAVVRSFAELDPYENFLAQIVLSSERKVEDLQGLADLAPKLSWSSYLRLLCLTANLEQNPTVKEELNRKIQLIIGTLDSRSQVIWNHRLKQALQTPELRVDLSVRSRSVTVQGKMIDLSKKKIGLQLLAGLVESATLSVDDAIQLLWQSSFTPEHYHRLRMSTHRLNTLINEFTGVGKLIEVDSQTVRLRPEIKLVCSDDRRGSVFLDL